MKKCGLEQAKQWCTSTDIKIQLYYSDFKWQYQRYYIFFIYIIIITDIFNGKILKKSFYLKAEKVPNTPAELIPTAKPTIKPILTRSKQEGPATGGGW